MLLIGRFHFDSLTLPFWFDLFLEARAEMLEKKFRWCFGRFEDTNRTFCNYLTFSATILKTKMSD